MPRRKLPSRTPFPAAPAALDDDRRLFERGLAGVRPLPGPTRVPLSPSGQGRPREAGPAAPSLTGLTVEREGGRVTGASFGVSRELLHDLGGGAARAEATCDLHGLRAEAARAQLIRFVSSSAELGRRMVLVICGRGVHSGGAGPVLLELAIATLSEPPVVERVLAFASAPPALGGEGALMVRLRRRY